MSSETSRYVGARRIMFFIDGGYIRSYLRNNFHDDFLNFDDFLAPIISQIFPQTFFPEIIRVYYYDAMPEKSEKQSKISELYFGGIKSLPGFEDRWGTLKRSIKVKKKPEQKGVDVLIATDILTKAYQDHYDIAVLLTGDEDFIPLVDAVKNSGKRIYGVFFEGSNFTDNLKDSFDSHLVINRKWMIDSGIKGKVEISEFSISNQLKAGITTKIVTKISGSISNGLIRLLLVSPAGTEYEFTDPNSWDSKNNIPLVQIQDSEYSSSWNFNIPSDADTGKYKVYLFLNEVKGRHKIITYNEKEVELTS